MSEPTCPGCGAEVREEYSNYRRFDCMALEFDADGPIKYEFRADKECLSRQIAQRDERNAALEVRALKLEKALRRLADANPLRGRALHGNDKLPGCEEFYRGYNAGVDTQLAFSSEIARKALEEAGHE